MPTLAYIASPYGAIKKTHPKLGEKEIRTEAHGIAYHVAAIARSKGYAPVSPIILWAGVYEENNPLDRELALKAGKVLMTACDVFIWTDTKYSELSDGMKAERAAAYEMGMRIEKIKI